MVVKSILLIILLNLEAGFRDMPDFSPTVSYPFGSQYLLSKRTLFLFRVQGLAELSSYGFADDSGKEAKSGRFFSAYPEAKAMLRFNRLGFGVSGAKILDAGGMVLREADTVHDIIIYSLSTRIDFQPSEELGFLLGYNHYLGYYGRMDEDARVFGHAPGLFAGTNWSPNEASRIGFIIRSPALTSSYRGGEGQWLGISLPLVIMTDLRLQAGERFEGMLFLGYKLGRFADSISLSLPEEDIAFSFYENDVFDVGIGARYVVSPGVRFGISGRYSSQGNTSLIFPDPAGLAASALVSWEKGIWLLSAELGTARLLGLNLEDSFVLEGNSYFLELRAGLIIPGT